MDREQYPVKAVVNSPRQFSCENGITVPDTRGKTVATGTFTFFMAGPEGKIE